MKSTPLVPSWLTGTWTRSYIRRANASNNGVMGEPDSTVEVKYIQTPWAFVDIRRPPTLIPGSKEVSMAFAGVTTVIGDDNPTLPPLVQWHSCLEMDAPDMDCLNRWSEADDGSPRATADKGYFENVSEKMGIPHAYKENDPENTLEELWIRINDGDNQFLGARKDKELLVIAGNHFGYANQDSNVFVGGIISSENEFVIEVSANNAELEGSKLQLGRSGWTVLAGSTIDIDSVFSSTA